MATAVCILYRGWTALQKAQTERIHRSFNTLQVTNIHPVLFWLIFIFSQQSRINTKIVTWHGTNTRKTKWRDSTNNRTCLTQYEHKRDKCRCRNCTVSAAGCLNCWRRNFFFKFLAHPVYKMWIKQEPNTLELWNKLHFEERKKKRRVYAMFKIFSTYIFWINI